MDDDDYNDRRASSPYDPRNPSYASHTAYPGEEDYSAYTHREPTGLFTYGQIAYGACVFVIAGVASAYLFN